MAKESTVTIQKTAKRIKLQKLIGGTLLVIAFVLVLGRENPAPWATIVGAISFVIGAGLYIRAAWLKWWEHD